MYKEIYLIDDDGLVNQIHALYLQQMGVGHLLRSYTNPEAALEVLRVKNEIPEKTLILLDINMPEISGFEFLEAMVRDNFSLEYDVLIVSSSESKVDRERASRFKKYVRAFISKPLQKEDLKPFLTVP